MNFIAPSHRLRRVAHDPTILGLCRAGVSPAQDHQPRKIQCSFHISIRGAGETPALQTGHSTRGEPCAFVGPASRRPKTTDPEKTRADRLLAVTKSGAAELPFLRSMREAGDHRIILRIHDKPLKRRLIPHEMIERLPLPHRPLSFQDPVDLMSRERLPRLNDARQRMTFERCYDGVNVIGHHAPGTQRIPRSLKVHQCALDDSGQFWQSEHAITGSVLGFQSLRYIFWSMIVDLALPLHTPKRSHIREAERHEVGAAVLENMRQRSPELDRSEWNRSGIDDLRWKLRFLRRHASFPTRTGPVRSSTPAGAPAPQHRNSIVRPAHRWKKSTTIE